MSGIAGRMAQVGQFMNQFQNTMGQVQGAMDAMAPALANVNYGLTNTMQVLNGHPPSAYYQYPQGGYIPAAQGPTTSFGDDNLALGMVGAAAGGGLGGAIAAKAVLNKGAEASVASAAKTGFASGLKAIGSAALKGTGIGAAIGGVTSLVTGLLRGDRGGTLAGAVAADTVGGAASGLAATAAGGLAAAGLAAVGVAGLPLTLAGIGVGILGGMAADYGFRNTGIRQWISDKVSGLIG